MRSPVLRAALALLLFSGWMALLFWGFALGGGVHLLLAGALGAFPWRAARTLTPGPSPDLSPLPHRERGDGQLRD
jgi:membrane protein required for beta-lactamase induction